MKPYNAAELPVHCDLSDAGVEQALEFLAVAYPRTACLSVSVWDAQLACEIMVRMKSSFYVKVTPHYSIDEWSMEYEGKCVWTPGA